MRLGIGPRETLRGGIAFSLRLNKSLLYSKPGAVIEDNEDDGWLDEPDYTEDEEMQQLAPDVRALLGPEQQNSTLILDTVCVPFVFWYTLFPTGGQGLPNGDPVYRLATFGMVQRVGTHDFGPAGICVVLVCEKWIGVYLPKEKKGWQVQGVSATHENAIRQETISGHK